MHGPQQQLCFLFTVLTLQAKKTGLQLQSTTGIVILKLLMLYWQV